MICNDCRSTEIKTRKNYSHGSKSKPIITRVCTKCGSYNIEAGRMDHKGKRWQGHRR